MPFCYAPWTNIDISPMGDISPCCNFSARDYSEKPNVRSPGGLETYYKSKLLTDTKEQFLKREWPAGCKRCQSEESIGIESKRILDYRRWELAYNAYEIGCNSLLTASIAFGNTCNLKCITCTPYASSKWQQEYHQLYGVFVKHHRFYKDSFVDEFVKHAPNLLHLDIPGGEPFLSGVSEQKELLRYYRDTNCAGNITLHYTTNAQQFPSDDWWEYWKSFKEVEIQLSIDGVGPRYEYIRFLGKWELLKSIISQYQEKTITCPNLRLSVSHTLSAYNVFYLDEFFNWNEEQGLPDPWVGLVHRPDHMKIGVWSRLGREEISRNLSTSRYPTVKHYSDAILKVDDSTFSEEFKRQVLAHDNYRGTSFAATFNEMAKYL